LISLTPRILRIRARRIPTATRTASRSSSETAGSGRRAKASRSSSARPPTRSSGGALGTLLTPDLAARPGTPPISTARSAARAASRSRERLGARARARHRRRPAWVVAVRRNVREWWALKSRLITSGRLAAMGQLAAGIAHEINNRWRSCARTWCSSPKAGTRSRSPATRPARARGALRRGEEMLDECLEGVERTCAIVRDIRASRTRRRRPGAGRARAAPRDVLRVASPQIGAGATVERARSRRSLRWPASAGAEAALPELVVNAAQAIGGAARSACARSDGRRVTSRSTTTAPAPARSDRQDLRPVLHAKPSAKAPASGSSSARGSCGATAARSRWTPKPAMDARWRRPGRGGEDAAGSGRGPRESVWTGPSPERAARSARGQRAVGSKV